MTVDELAEGVLTSKLYQLAKIQLYREGRAEKIKMPSGKVFYDAEFPDILDTMNRIVCKLHETKQGFKK